MPTEGMLWDKKKTRQLRFFVSIGSGLNQIPLIKEAKKLKFNVIGVDYNTAAPGFYSCDLKIQESIENRDIIYKKLRELLVDGEISGIMTKSYGHAIVTTSYLAEKFNIPFLPYGMSRSFISKKRMKSIFRRRGIRTPEAVSFTPKTKPEKLPAAAYPVIVKPDTGHAKFNVRLARNATELNDFLSGRSDLENYILEKFTEGDEIIAAGIIHEKKYHLVQITDKKTTFPPYFIDIMHTAPSRYCHCAGKITAVGQAVADAFSITASPLIMEFIVDGNEELHLIEAAPEFGGEFLPDILVPASTGYNLIREAILSMTKKSFSPPPPVGKNRAAVAVRYITAEKGILASCNPDGPGKENGTIFARIFKEIGSPVNDPVTNLDRIGVVIVAARSVQDAIALSQKAADNFNIRIKPA
jgi:biotin carboxylase